MTVSEDVAVAAALTLDDLRVATVELLGAERRLRGRDQQSEDLTQSQLRALFALGKAEAVPAGQLAKSADLHPASVTSMLDILEEKGIVERRRDSKDRRLCMVSLTETGRAIVAKRRDRWNALWQKSFADLTEEEVAIAVRVIRTLTELLDSL